MPIKINNLVCDYCSRSISKSDPDAIYWKIEKTHKGTRVFCPRHDTKEKRNQK